MFYIISTILISVLLLVIFKLYAKYNVNSLVAIIVNYFVATLTGILFYEGEADLHKIFATDWIFVCVPLGGIFIAVFYLIGLTAQKIGLSTASVANKMSVVIPVLFSIIVLKDQLSWIKSCGILLALIAVYLSTRSGENGSDPEKKKLVWLPALVFLGSGIIDTTINAANSYLVHTTEEKALFSICTFLSAFITGCFIVFYHLIKKISTAKNLFSFKNIIGGIALGIPNYFSIYFIFKSLDANIMNSAQLFPVLNLCNVAISAFLGWLVFREKLSAVNVAGIVLALISIVIIAL
jgi:drug/metabolite transporter (DMT)-like permease